MVKQRWQLPERLLIGTLLVLISLLGFGVLSSAQANHKKRPYEFLVLHSYSTDYQWTNDANQGIFTAIHRDHPEALIRVEYMDTKNIYNPDYLAHLVQLYRYKYATHQLDGIILTDNNAMSFFLEHGESIFPNVPAVAAGINAASPPPSDSNLKSVIAELAYHEKTISHALKLMPQVENLYVLSDATPTGQLLSREAQQALQPYEGLISIHFVSGLEIAELKEFTDSMTAKDLIYVLPYFRASSGETYSQGSITEELAASGQTPVVVSWAFQMNTGALGGQMISSRRMGEQAGVSLLQILNGKYVSPFQSDSDLSQAVFDYNVFSHFQLNELALPVSIHWLNKPASFYETHKAVFVPAIILIAILGLISALLMLNLQKQKALNANNKRLMNLDKEVIETQRELVTTLGEVIEMRSHETRFHVLRVAKICRLLGEKVGLREHELDLLELASSMHDVGKIGLPESILHKPSDLSLEEQELMKTHTRIGRDILGNSDRELMVMSRDIAYQHHEHWDGSGYPNGMAGEEISIYARITTLADVYDAISSNRSYKQAWPESKVLEYIQQNSSTIFDPQLVELFIENLSDIRAIRLAHM